MPRALAALAVASTCTLGAFPAHAQEGDPVVPRAEAQATALRVSLLGNELVVSSADTAASSAPSARANGTGALLATTAFGQTSATADAANPAGGSEDPTCSDISLPADIPLPVGVITACSAAREDLPYGVPDEAFVPGDGPHASAGSGGDDERRAPPRRPASSRRARRPRRPWRRPSPFALGPLMITVATHIAWYLRRSRPHRPIAGQASPA